MRPNLSFRLGPDRIRIGSGQNSAGPIDLLFDFSLTSVVKNDSLPPVTHAIDDYLLSYQALKPGQTAEFRRLPLVPSGHRKVYGARVTRIQNR